MGSVLTPGILAILCGVTVTILAFVPLVAIAYRRRGRLGSLRIVGWFATAIYGFSLLTYTLLPLPAHRQLTQCTVPQLHPLGSIAPIADYPHDSLRALASNPALLQVVLNVALFLPLGALLRWMGRRGWPWALGLGFLISLCIETTQLTGVWGIYSCSYRVFDVDDLAANTAGAVLGSLFAIPFARQHAPREHRTTVTLWRVLLAVGCDLLLMFLGGALLVILARLAVLAQGASISTLPTEAETALQLGIPALAEALSVLGWGRTLGEGAVLLQGVSRRWSPWLSRPIKFLTGIGGLQLLLALPNSELAVLLFGVVSAVLLFPTRTHRGLPGWASGIDLVDARPPLPPR